MKRSGQRVLGWLVVGLSAWTGGLARAQASGAKPDRFAAIAFLEGTWEARATRPDGVEVSGRYAFVPELNGTVLARHSTEDSGCKGPAIFDCAHSDLLYVFQDAPGQALKAVYFDSEGHVIHYALHAISPMRVEFLSEPAGPGPQFRLVYALEAGVMQGRFQIRLPGAAEWKSYLEWSGGRVAKDQSAGQP